MVIVGGREVLKLVIWVMLGLSILASNLSLCCQTHIARKARWRALWSMIRFMPSFRMPRDPFKKLDDQHSEYGFAEGRFPNPVLDYSGSGSLSRISIADPDRTEQIRQLAAGKRTDLNNASEPNPASPYVLGNTDRYGAQPELVRNRRKPKPSQYQPAKPARMERHW